MDVACGGSGSGVHRLLLYLRARGDGDVRQLGCTWNDDEVWRGLGSHWRRRTTATVVAAEKE